LRFSGAKTQKIGIPSLPTVSVLAAFIWLFSNEKRRGLKALHTLRDFGLKAELQTLLAAYEAPTNGNG
jgi:hypothetical protein